MVDLLSWFFFSASGLAAMVWGWINFGGGYGRALGYRLPQPDQPRESPPFPDKQLPGVAIISPGRDEAEHLPTVLPELCEQDYPNLMVVFVDDASTDATPQITAELTQKHDNLLVLRNEQEPPAGWMGKCWAVYRGYETVRSAASERATKIDWLCFTDADIHWHPRLLRTAIEYATEHDADLIGVLPTLRFGSVGEAIVQLQLALALGLLFPLEKAMDPNTEFALTSGAFILTRRSFYDEIGGHEAVKGEMVEDIKLGSAIKAAGAKHRVAMAGDLQWCRMYDGWADMWEGLTKNAYAGVEHRWWRAMIILVATLLINILPPVYAAVSVVWLIVDPGWMSGTTLLFSLVTVMLHARALNTTRKLTHLPWPYAWTMIVGNTIYASILFTSVWQYYIRGNKWKGRRYGAADTKAG